MIRLARKPSLWLIFLAHLGFAILWSAAVFGASYFVWVRRGRTSTLAVTVLVLFDLIAIGLIWDVVVRLWRTLNHRHPLVEIDRQSLAYGDSAQVHIIEPHPRSIAEMGVKLIGECYAQSATDISSYRETKTALNRCYEEELLRLKLDSADPVSRLVQMQLPKSPPADGISWKIVVDSRLKRGGVIEHGFPLKVRESA